MDIYQSPYSHGLSNKTFLEKRKEKLWLCTDGINEFIFSLWNSSHSNRTHNGCFPEDGVLFSHLGIFNLFTKQESLHGC